MLNFFDLNKVGIERQLTLCFLGTMVLFLLPFAIYRFFTGDTLQFVVDLVMSAIAGFAFIQSWRRKKTKKFNFFCVLAFLSVVTVLIYFKGMEMIYWVFPSMIGAYFLIASTPAFIMNVVFIGVITILYFEQFTKNDITSIYPSLLLVCIFGYVLSKRAEFQNKKLFKLVSEDTLTGVKNRRSFDEKIEQVLANYKRAPQSISMLLFDLDYFKKINDSYGHKQGDKVLIDFAKTVKAIIRSTDDIYRFGGEEFVVIANSSLDNSGELAELIREYTVQSPSLSKYKITVSVGVSEISKNDDSDSWFRRADSALYESKTSGRNKVSLAKFDENADVYFEAFRPYRKIKPISSKTHSSILSQDDDNSDHLRKHNQRNLEIVNTADKV